jgi:hypothetical protein
MTAKMKAAAALLHPMVGTVAAPLSKVDTVVVVSSMAVSLSMAVHLSKVDIHRNSSSKDMVADTPHSRAAVMEVLDLRGTRMK